MTGLPMVWKCAVRDRPPRNAQAQAAGTNHGPISAGETGWQL